MKYIKTYENYLMDPYSGDSDTETKPITQPVTKPDTNPRPNISPIPTPQPGTEGDPQAFDSEDFSYDWLVYDQDDTETQPITKPPVTKPDTNPRPKISPIPTPQPGTEGDPQAKKGTIRDRFGDFTEF